MVYVLTVFVVIDYITGVMRAVGEKKLSSEVGFKGICKKVLILPLLVPQISWMSRLLEMAQFCALP